MKQSLKRCSFAVVVLTVLAGSRNESSQSSPNAESTSRSCTLSIR